MNKLGCLIISLGLACLSTVYAQGGGQCPSGQCGFSNAAEQTQEKIASRSAPTVIGSGDKRPIYSGVPQFSHCAPGECYLFEELVSCSVTDYNCKDGKRRIWSYRPQFYRVDNSELLMNLDKKLCSSPRNCMWPYSRRDSN